VATQRRIVASFIAALLVVVAYHPADSVAVEHGDSVWLAAAAFGALAVWFAFELLNVFHISSTHPPPSKQPTRTSIALDVFPWILGGWMMLAAFGSSPPGNLRQATNEAWVWVSAAALFFLSRRLFASDAIRRMLLVLLFGGAVLQSVHALHQQFISLPQMRLQYEANPDAMLASVGIDAPEGSGERNVFESRLYDGGPTGTFALANSLAGVLLFGVLLSASLIWLRFFSMTTSERIGWLLLLGLLSAALILTRSRSSVIAVFCGFAFVVLMTTEIRKRVFVWLSAGTLLAIVLLGILLSAFRRREWFEQAPASLSFRLQYWRSTLRMVAEYPLFGAGPGNFQSIYERFREPSANESIADPHHFFFETIGSGGVVAGIILVLGIFVFAIEVYAKYRRDPPSKSSLPVIDRSVETSIGIGAGAGLLIVWLGGLLTLNIPDLDAHTFAVPIAIASIVFATPSLRRISGFELNVVALSILGAIMIHLSISSGWTIPGIAIFVWLCAAAVVPKCGDEIRLPEDAGSKSLDTKWQKRLALLRLIGTVVGLLCVVRMSWLPITRQKSAIAIAESELMRGRLLQADRWLETAEQADPWSANASRWRAEVYRRRLVRRDSANDRLRDDWQASIERSKQRSGEDPAAYRDIGTAQLHVYQRFGDSVDLDAAYETFKQAAAWNPSDQWLAAQLSEVARAEGNAELAEQMGERARWLSGLSRNLERMLDRQYILVAKKIGQPASAAPIRQPADELL